MYLSSCTIQKAPLGDPQDLQDLQDQGDVPGRRQALGDGGKSMGIK
jgi:hypothetical protein